MRAKATCDLTIHDLPLAEQDRLSSIAKNLLEQRCSVPAVEERLLQEMQERRSLEGYQVTEVKLAASGKVRAWWDYLLTFRAEVANA